MHQTYILHREAPIMIGLPHRTAHNTQFIRLMPGANVIPSDSWDFIKDDDIIQNLIFEKTLIILEHKAAAPDAPINEVIDITTRPESEAKAVIKATFVEAPLLAWLAAEKKKHARKSVINCLNDQLEEVQGKPAKDRRQ